MVKREINRSYKNITGIIVLKKGETIYKNYYNGYGENSSIVLK